VGKDGRLRIKYVALIVAVLVIWWWGVLYGQVNTEAMRKTDLEPGIQGKVSLSFGYMSGNTEVLTLKTGFRADYMARPYHTFLVTNYQRGTEDKELFINKGFVHARGIRALSRRWRVEMFLQKEFNDFIDLEDRNLAGGGFRWAPLLRGAAFTSNPEVNIYVGVGAMWEREVLGVGGDEETDIIRSTNYLSGNWQIDDRVGCFVTGYYQVDVEEFSDYRILADGGISFAVSKILTFSMDVYFRYDHDPPTDIEKHDLEISNGFGLTF
jgi:hypothetical protein